MLLTERNYYCLLHLYPSVTVQRQTLTIGPPSRDNHRKAFYPYTLQRDQRAS